MWRHSFRSLEVHPKSKTCTSWKVFFPQPLWMCWTLERANVTFFFRATERRCFHGFKGFTLVPWIPPFFWTKRSPRPNGDGAKARESYPNKIPAHSKVINNYPTSVVWKLGDARNKCQASRSESVLGVNLRFLNGKMWSLVDCGMFPNGEMDWCTYSWRTWLGHGTLKDMIESTMMDKPRPADGGKGVKEGREDCNFRNWQFFSWTVCLLQWVDEVKQEQCRIYS